MKNRIIMFLVSLIFVPSLVSAECLSNEFNSLKQKAYDVNISYEYVEDSIYEGGDANFNVYASNVTDGILLKYGYLSYTLDEVNDDGLVSINGIFIEGNTYYISIYSNTSSCSGELLLKKKVSLPVFNEFSLRDECYGLSEYEYCQRWYKGKSPSEDEFLKAIDEYKNDQKQVDDEDDSSFFSKIIEFVINNLGIVIPTSIFLVGIITYILIDLFKRRKRIKLKI